MSHRIGRAFERVEQDISKQMEIENFEIQKEGWLAEVQKSFKSKRFIQGFIRGILWGSVAAWGVFFLIIFVIAWK